MCIIDDISKYLKIEKKKSKKYIENLNLQILTIYVCHS